MLHQPTVSYSISIQIPFNRAGGRPSNARLKEMRIILLSFLVASLVSVADAEETVEKDARYLPVMTWYHPLLGPGLKDMTLLCTVVSVSKGLEIYESATWNVRLRIDERVYVQPRYEKRLEGVKFLTSSDFRKRKSGEKIVVFAGLGEPYEGDDFLIPCWSGTNTDLGILLPSDDDWMDRNEALLKSLRQQVKNPKATSEDFEAFAAFCPKGVAEYFIQDLRHKELRESDDIEPAEKTDAGQGGADQPATAPKLKMEGKDKPQPEKEAAPR